MKLFIGEVQYFSVEDYAASLLKFANEHDGENITINIYRSDEDRISSVNAIGGFVPQKPYDYKQFCDGVRFLEKYIPQ